MWGLPDQIIKPCQECLFIKRRYCVAMGSFDIWKDFGFIENPYSQSTLKADDVGNKLLAGRDTEIRSLQKRIGTTGAHPSVEGPIGAGKTSLVNVAIYRMQQTCLQSKGHELYIPAVGEFQPTTSTNEFEQWFYYVIAQTLVRNVGLFSTVGLETPNIAILDRWLNNPKNSIETSDRQGESLSLNAEYDSEPKANTAFAPSGFREAVRELLEKSFPPGAGGIVCVLDNLEILQSAGKARDALDKLRDRVFNIPQIRWVLCGSRGIVSRARTERLSGMMHTPLIVKPISDDSAVEAIRRRIEHFGLANSVAPVTPEGFDFIYQTLNKNLRESLTKSSEFSQWLDDQSDEENWDEYPDESERTILLSNWIMELAQLALDDAKGIRPRDWQFFDALCAAGGRAGSGEHKDFGFNEQPQLVAAITNLVDTNLMSREIDPTNGQRTINSVTPTGWLVYFCRKNFGSDGASLSEENFELDTPN